MITVADMQRETGLTYRQLDHWTRRGWLTPDNAHAGTGTSRLWNRSDLLVGRLMAHLGAAGFAPDIAYDHALRLLAAPTRPAQIELAPGHLGAQAHKLTLALHWPPS